jgi:hypothetical protein
VITGLPDCVRRELRVGGFELLKTHDVGLGFSKPAQQVSQATVDVVDVETGDLHRFGQRSGRIDLALELRFDRSQRQSLALKAS